MEMTPNQGGQKNFFEQLNPKSAMAVGVVGAFMTLCTIGFFVLLSMYLKGTLQHVGGNLANVGDVQVGQGTTGDTLGAQGQVAGAPVAVEGGRFPAKGNANAPITIIEFADFRCPFCERFYKDALAGIMKDYVATGKAKLYFRNYAFLGPGSTLAAQGAECANEQGKFWVYHDWMFDHQAPESDTAYYTFDNMVTYARQMGLNANSFSSCLKSNKYASAVSGDLAAGQQAGVNGTPTIFINGQPLVGAQPYEAVKAAIEQVLQK